MCNVWKLESLLTFVHEKKARGSPLIFPNGPRKDASMVDHEDSQRGQGLLEYSMLIILVAVLIIVVIALLGPSTGNLSSDAVTMF